MSNLSLYHLPRIWRFLRDPKTSWKPKALAVFVIVYLFWTIDLIPDFIPLFGLLDDIGFTVFAYWYLARLAERYGK